MLSKEELMKPRYKVVADYPGNGFKVGDILPDCWDGKEFPEAIIDHSLDEVPKYPHLFKPLAWWEGRLPEDMPEYIKDEDGQIFKVAEYSNGDYIRLYKNFGDYERPIGGHSLYELTPATIEDFNQFHKQIQ